MTNRWLKITVDTEPVLLEPISDFLVGILGAGVEEAAPDEPHYGRIQGYIQQPNLSQAEQEEIMAKLSLFVKEIAGAMSLPLPSLSVESIEDQDWGRDWKVHFHPFTIVPGLVIAPTWEEYQAEAGEQVIVMDPGMAFGTGHHATTSLCLEGIRNRLLENECDSVLDVGTGTGILGMAALLFGARSVLAVDNDEDAVSAARENVERNGLSEQMTVNGQALSEITTSFDLVVANIVQDVLLMLGDDLGRLTRSDGELILSGLMGKDQVARLKEFFASRGFSPVVESYQEEWGALRLRKTG